MDTRISSRASVVVAVIAAVLAVLWAPAAAAPRDGITEYQLPSGPVTGVPAGLTGIAAGPDGNMWFTEENANLIGRITPAGRHHRIPRAYCRQSSVWDCGWPGRQLVVHRELREEDRADHPGRRHYRVPPARCQPAVRDCGRPGWQPVVHPLGRDRADHPDRGRHRVPPARRRQAPLGIAAGPDGNLWFTEAATGNRIGRITPTGTITEYPLPTADS